MTPSATVASTNYHHNMIIIWPKTSSLELFFWQKFELSTRPIVTPLPVTNGDAVTSEESLISERKVFKYLFQMVFIYFKLLLFGLILIWDILFPFN